MSFQVEVSAGRITLLIQGVFGPPEAALLRDALLPLLQGRRRDLVLDLSRITMLEAPALQAIQDLKAFAHLIDRRLILVHGDDPEPSLPASCGIT